MPTLYLYMQAQLVLLIFREEFQHLQDDPGIIHLKIKFIFIFLKQLILASF